MKAKTIIGLPLFLGFPFLMKFLPRGVVYTEVFMWLVLLSLILWIYFVEKRTIASVGWKKLSLKMLFVAIGLGVVSFILFAFLSVSIQALGLELNQDVAEMFASQPFFVLMLVALRAGVVEEVLYRGYAYERINELTRSKFLAGMVPLIIFVLLHVSWGLGHLVFVFIVGGLFTILYAKKRNVIVNIIAHFTVDVIVMVFLPMMLEA